MLSRKVVKQAHDLVSELSFDSFDFGCGVEYDYAQVSVPADYSASTTEALGTAPEMSEESDVDKVVDVPLHPAFVPTKPSETVPDSSLAAIKPRSFRLSNRILQKLLIATIKSITEHTNEPAIDSAEDLCHTVTPVAASVEFSNSTSPENLCSEDARIRQPVFVTTTLEESAAPDVSSVEADPTVMLVKSPSRFCTSFTTKHHASLPPHGQTVSDCIDASSDDPRSKRSDGNLLDDTTKPVRRLLLKRVKFLFMSKSVKYVNLADEGDSDACFTAALQTQLLTRFLRKRFILVDLKWKGASFTVLPGCSQLCGPSRITSMSLTCLDPRQLLKPHSRERSNSLRRPKSAP